MGALTWWQVRESGQRWGGFICLVYLVCAGLRSCVCVATRVLQHSHGGRRTPQVLLLNLGQSLLLLIAVFTDGAGPGVSGGFLVSALPSR